MVVFPEPAFDKDYGDLLPSVCMKLRVRPFAALPGFHVSFLTTSRSADSYVSENQAIFDSDFCEAEASGRCFEECCVPLEISKADNDYVIPQSCCEMMPSVYGEVGKGPDVSRRMRQKDLCARLALAKNKDDDDDDEDEDEEWEDDDDDDEEDNDDTAKKEGGGDEDEGEEDVEDRNEGGGEDDDDDDDDDENGKGDDEEDEDAIEAEDEDDEDGVGDEEDEDEEDDDEDGTPEPPQKKRK